MLPKPMITRTNPAYSAKVSMAELDQLTLGQPIHITRQIKKTDYKISFILVSFFLFALVLTTTLIFINKDKLLAMVPQPNTVGVVVKEQAILREGNGIEYPVVSALNKSQMLVVLDTTVKGWVKVQLDSNHIGWTERDNLVY